MSLYPSIRNPYRPTRTQTMSIESPWHNFPALQADPTLIPILASAQVIHLPPHAPVFMPGAPCQNYLLVVRGSVRVQLLTENGREIVLYHVGDGDSCVLTTSCLLGATRYPAGGIAETDVTAIALPAADFNRALARSEAFRRFVFGNLGRRLADVIARMEQVAFAPVDGRLATALLNLTRDDPRLSLTHQELAVELGSAREVVSRHLKRFEDHGWVRLGRASIEVLNRAALQNLAGAD